VTFRAARLDGLGTTIFTEMAALAQGTGAINLGQGFPDTDGPAEAIAAALLGLLNPGDEVIVLELTSSAPG
jgi:N-succinyldiaminopimelate aminotransferase